MLLVAGAGSSLGMVTHRLIGQASTQIKNSADWSQLRCNEWDDSTLLSCMQTTQEMTPGTTNRCRFEVKWLSSVSGGNPPALTPVPLHPAVTKACLVCDPRGILLQGLSLFPVQTSLLCRQDYFFSHSSKKQSSGVWRQAWLSLGASQVQAGLISGGTGNVFEGNTLPAPLKPYQGSGCFIYNDFSCRMAPVCYSCIEYAQIILVHRVIGGIAKLHLMTEWQPSGLRAFNGIFWRIIFFSCLWSWKKQSWGWGEMISWVYLLCF